MVVRPYSLVVLALLFSCSWAHMCLISPPQRGSMEDINTPSIFFIFFFIIISYLFV